MSGKAVRKGGPQRGVPGQGRGSGPPRGNPGQGRGGPGRLPIKPYI